MKFFFQQNKFAITAGNFILSLLLTAISNSSAFGQPKSIISPQNREIKNTYHPVYKKYTVSGKVTQTFPYCGGANPPKQILDKLATPGAFVNKKFYVRTGKINNINSKIIESFTTDSNGVFLVKLPAGTYAIILEEQLHKIKWEDYKKPNQQVDIKCLNEWWAKPYYLLIVKNKGIADLKFNFQHRCYIDSDIPCITYKGPVHP